MHLMPEEQLKEWENMSLKELNPSWDSSLILAKDYMFSQWEINSEWLEISKNEKYINNKNKLSSLIFW